MAEPLLIAQNSHTSCQLLPGLANRHGLITGATGTGKTVTLQKLAESFSDIGVPVLAGLSRKKTIGEITGREVPRDRVHGSVAAHLIAAQNGAAIVRVHDVAATVDALRVWNAVAAVPAPRTAAAPAIRWPDED